VENYSALYEFSFREKEYFCKKRGNVDLNPDKSSSDSDDTKKIEIHSSGDFVAPSFFLFLDIFLVSIGGWIFWLVMTKLTSSSELGLAVTVYSLVLLVTTLTQLGLEYPLLKRSNIQRSQILGTSFMIELLITLASIPFVYIVINTLYDKTVEQFTWISIGLLLIISLEFVFRFGLLGISNSKIVLIIDLVGVGIKLSTGFILVSMSLGTLGILLAYLFEGLFVIFTSLYFIKKSFSFRMGNIGYFKEIIEDALVNTPAKWSKMVIVILSVVLLAIFNISTSEVGIFYVALMITIVVAGFASSMAYMVIPSSTTLKKDLSSSSLRLSLSLTAPVVVALLVAPRSILSLIGPEYESAATVLFVLAIAIIPSSITINMISKLNNLNKSKILILSGFLQMAIFFVSFFVLVPIYETIGAAFSILFAYLGSSSFLLILTKHGSSKYIVSTCLSLLAGFTTGYTLSMIISNEQQLLILICSVAVSIVVVVASKSMTIKETILLVKAFLRKK
jgi:O-antigen/teichoic acid export membrane protein